jgi:phage-related protein
MTPAIALIKGFYTAVKAVVDFIIAIPSKIKSACDWISKHVGGLTSGHANLTVTTRAGGNAQGTPYWRGGLTKVNERGGEIMDLPTGTRIIPHDVSVEMARSQARSNGRTTIINIPKLADQFVVRSDDDIDKIADALATHLENWSGDLA